MNKNMTQGQGFPVNSSANFVEKSLDSIGTFLNLSGTAKSNSTVTAAGLATVLAPRATRQAVTSVSPVSQLAYHELADVPVREVDSLEQLEKNIQVLSDIRTRLQFMNRELRYLMKL